MVFNSLTFLIFFPAVLAVYLVLPKKIKKYWLLLASYYFYASWNLKYAVLILISTLITYLSGILLSRSDSVKTKKWIVAGSLLTNLGILFVFKYLGFFFDTLNHFLSVFGIKGLENHLYLLLPVGISFYTFQALGYTIDVYRGTIEPEKNIVRYALFVSFFPQLVAGPIERSGNLLSQIRKMEKETLVTYDRFVRGAITALYGFILKMIIADRISILVKTAFDPEFSGLYYGFQLVLAVLLFSIQIYCDFAGYSYIAIGTASMMGFKLCDNFITPYLSGNVKGFWAGWHISLTSWFRDYLYIPLGGNRKGKLRKYINIMIVFLVSGLWHGASLHFVFWGALNGILQIYEDLTKGLRNKLAKLTGYDTTAFSHKLICTVKNFLVVSFVWIFFRADSTMYAFQIIKDMFRGIGLWQLTDGSLLSMGLDGKEMNVLIIFLILMIIVDILRKYRGDVAEIFIRQNKWFLFSCLFLGIAAVVLFGVYGADYNASQFMYFQF